MAGAASGWRRYPGVVVFLGLALGIVGATLPPVSWGAVLASPFRARLVEWLGRMLAAGALAAGLAPTWRLGPRRAAVWAALVVLSGTFLAVGAESAVRSAFAPVWQDARAGVGQYTAEITNARAEDAEFEAKTVAFMARVVGLPSEREDRTDLVARVVEGTGEGRAPALGATVLVKARPVIQGLRHGDLVWVKGSLSLPQPPGNPGEFDYQRYLLSRGIGAVLSGSAIRLGSEETVRGPQRLAAAVRERVDRALASTFPPGRDTELALLRGILFGDTSGLPPEVMEEFRDAGVFHILAVSGSNVAFLLAGWYGLFGFCVRRTDWWTGGWAARIRAGTALVIVAVYAMMTGAGPSVVRASLMAAAWLLGQVAGRKTNVWNALGLAGAFILASSPSTLFDPGFQLSFAATTGIMLWSGPLARRLPQLRGTWARLNGYRTITAATLAAQLATWPVSAYHFGRVAVLGLPANLLVVPVSGWLVTGGAAAGLTSLAMPFLGRILNVANYVSGTILVRWTSTWGAIPGASLNVEPPAPALMAAYYLAILAVFLSLTMSAPPDGVGARTKRDTGWGARHPWVILAWAALSLAVAATWWGTGPALRGGMLQVTFLDVGQGDAALLRSPGGQAALVDTGPPDEPGAPGDGQGRLVSLLKRMGVHRLDWILVSHDHDDHDGNLDQCLRAFPVGVVFVSPGRLEEFLGKHPGLTKNGTPVRQVQFGDNFAWAGSRVEVLWPPPPDRGVAPERSDRPTDGSGSNDSSVVVRLVCGQAAFLFTGDIGPAVEGTLRRWAQAGWVFPRADVLKVSHHGSGTSSDTDFLGLLGARAAVVSVGRNVFGHPAPETLARLAQAGEAVWRTDRNGAVTVQTDGRTIRVRGYRRDRPCLAALGQDNAAGSKN